MLTNTTTLGIHSHAHSYQLLHSKLPSTAEVSFQRHLEADRATNTQQTWRQEFLGCRSSTVEWPSTRASAAGTLLWFFQTISENTSFWQLKRLVTRSTYRRYTNNFIYLSIPTFSPSGGTLKRFIAFCRSPDSRLLVKTFCTDSVNYVYGTAQNFCKIKYHMLIYVQRASPQTTITTYCFTAIMQDNLCQPAPPVKNWIILLKEFYCLHALADNYSD